MIRGWFRRRRVDVPQLDTAVFLGAQFDVRDARIEGLQDALGEAHKKLAEEKAARVREVAQLRGALAPYLVGTYLRQGIATAKRLAEEDTAVVSADQLRRTRPAPATEQYRRPR